MTQFKITESLKKKLIGIPKDELDSIKDNEYIDHKQLIEIYKKYKPTNSLLELVKTSKMHIPNKNIVESKPKSKEFIQLMERLRREQKEKEYKKLVSPKQQFETLYDNSNEEIITPSQMNKELKSNLTTIVNILISVEVWFMLYGIGQRVLGDFLTVIGYFYVYSLVYWYWSQRLWFTWDI